MRAYERNAAATWVPLVDVRVAARRVGSATVDRYREWLEQGREAPPVRLARHGDSFVVRDGRHRVAAALAAGHVVIEAEVRPIGRLGTRLWRWLVRAAAIAAARTFSPGMKLWRQSASLAPRRGGFDSRRLHFQPP